MDTDGEETTTTTTNLTKPKLTSSGTQQLNQPLSPYNLEDITSGTFLPKSKHTPHLTPLTLWTPPPFSTLPALLIPPAPLTHPVLMTHPVLPKLRQTTTHSQTIQKTTTHGKNQRTATPFRGFIARSGIYAKSGVNAISTKLNIVNNSTMFAILTCFHFLSRWSQLK